jgi:hypothetical protein
MAVAETGELASDKQCPGPFFWGVMEGLIVAQILRYKGKKNRYTSPSVYRDLRRLGRVLRVAEIF